MKKHLNVRESDTPYYIAGALVVGSFVLTVASTALSVASLIKK